LNPTTSAAADLAALARAVYETYDAAHDGRRRFDAATRAHQDGGLCRTCAEKVAEREVGFAAIEDANHLAVDAMIKALRVAEPLTDEERNGHSGWADHALRSVLIDDRIVSIIFDQEDDLVDVIVSSGNAVIHPWSEASGAV